MAEFIEKYINSNEALQVISQAKRLSEKEITYVNPNFQDLKGFYKLFRSFSFTTIIN